MRPVHPRSPSRWWPQPITKSRSKRSTSRSNAPIKGAHVLLHPYRAFTDDNGVAKIKLAKGTYKLFVSGFNYIAYENVIDVANDVTIRAELAAEPEGQEDYR